MLVLKLERWPKGITTARSIGRVFINPTETGYTVNIEYDGEGYDLPAQSESFTVETKSQNVVDVITEVFKHRSN